jgi:hypothetical protein
MPLEKRFLSFWNELKKSVTEFKISDELHNTFVMFIYTLYHYILQHTITIFTKIHNFAITHIPFPKINSI